MAKFGDEQIQTIVRGRKALGRFPFPGSEGDAMIGVRVLTDNQVDTARYNAQAHIEGRCKRVGLPLVDFINVDPESLDREHMRQVLLFAIVDPESDPQEPEPFFKSDDQVRGLDSVLVQQLWEIYLDWQDAVNPRLKLTEEEVKDLCESLKKEPNAMAILAHIERSTLQSLVRTLAITPKTSPTGKSSTSTN